MLIEQIIEFELRWPGPYSRTCTLTTSCFHDKTNSLRQIFEIYLLQNLAGISVPHFLLPGLNDSQNLPPKCKILNMFWI